MKPRVFITLQIPENGIKMIERYYEIDLWKDQREPPRDVLLEKITNADAIVTLVTDKVDKDLLDNASKLRIIAQYAVGYDTINLKDAIQQRFASIPYFSQIDLLLLVFWQWLRGEQMPNLQLHQ